MQAAARGALAVKPAEMVEILVYLANHNKVFGQQARMTLAGWEEKSSLEVAANPNSPREVLDYLIAPDNLRPRLLPALLENPSISAEVLAELAATGSREVLDAMRNSPRVQKLPAVMSGIASNPNSLEESIPADVPTSFEEAAPVPAIEDAGTVIAEATATETTAEETPEEKAAIDAFLTEHARELALEGEKPFQPLGGFHELEHEEPHTLAVALPAVAAESHPAETLPASTSAPSQSTVPAAAAHSIHAPKKPPASPEAERGSVLQKIAKLDVKGRIQMAMKGTKEERSILIRDGTKLVALAVLESGKISDGEVEKFASQKNVLEAVLRQIPMKRRFLKNYNVVRNLVANPRTPLDVSLGLIKNLLVSDLRNLSSNKEVSDTIRKLALKMYKQKTDTSKKSH
jgi:hypothetical protein